MLSQGADFTVLDAHGNTCLHLAALNEHRGVLEVLLRCGADPSIPNHSGTLAMELVSNPRVTELFHRDRNNIFSPMVTAKNLFGELLEQHSLASNASNNALPPPLHNHLQQQQQVVISTPPRSPVYNESGNYTLVGVTSGQKPSTGQKSHHFFPMHENLHNESSQQHHDVNR